MEAVTLPKKKHRRYSHFLASYLEQCQTNNFGDLLGNGTGAYLRHVIYAFTLVLSYLLNEGGQGWVHVQFVI